LKRIILSLVLILVLAVVGISGCTNTNNGNNSQGNSSNTTQGNSSYSSAPIINSSPLTLSGNGRGSTPVFHVNGGMINFEMTHNGKQNFVIHLMNTNGTIQDYVTSKVGKYNGSQALNVPKGDYILDVYADGSWTVKVSQIS